MVPHRSFGYRQCLELSGFLFTKLFLEKCGDSTEVQYAAEEGGALPKKGPVPRLNGWAFKFLYDGYRSVSSFQSAGSNNMLKAINFLDEEQRVLQSKRYTNNF